MKSKCEYCGSYLDEEEEICPNCGVLNSSHKKTAEGVPTTIEELKKWYIDHNLPDESVTRFFIGRDIRTAKAFGIYQDKLTGNFIVYKNKSDGVRVVRYKGTDEKYAVNELYLKLKEEMINQKQRNQNKIGYKNGILENPLLSEEAEPIKKQKKRKKKCKEVIVIFLTFFVILGISMIITFFPSPSRGYYIYNNIYYYYQSGEWYEYDNSLGWYETSIDDELEDNYDSYYDSSYYRSSYNIENFSDSDYYVAPSSSSSSSSIWDSDWDSS